MATADSICFCFRQGVKAVCRKVFKHLDFLPQSVFSQSHLSTFTMEIPVAQIEQLRTDYQNLLVEYFVAQHEKLCPVCLFTKDDIRADATIEADSVPWRAFAHEYLMKFVRPCLYSVRA